VSGAALWLLQWDGLFEVAGQARNDGALAAKDNVLQQGGKKRDAKERWVCVGAGGVNSG